MFVPSIKFDHDRIIHKLPVCMMGRFPVPPYTQAKKNIASGYGKVMECHAAGITLPRAQCVVFL